MAPQPGPLHSNSSVNDSGSELSSVDEDIIAENESEQIYTITVTSKRKPQQEECNVESQPRKRRGSPRRHTPQEEPVAGFSTIGVDFSNIRKASPMRKVEQEKSTSESEKPLDFPNVGNASLKRKLKVQKPPMESPKRRKITVRRSRTTAAQVLIEESYSEERHASPSSSISIAPQRNGILKPMLENVPPLLSYRGSRTNPVKNINQWHDDNYNNYIKVTKRNHWSNPGTELYNVKQMLKADECLAPDHLLKRPEPNCFYISNKGKHQWPSQYSWVGTKEWRTGHPKYAALAKHNQLHRNNGLYWGLMPKDMSIPLAGISGKTKLTNDELQEENFHARPSVHLPIPDHIKAILVDDWENVTKNCQLVPLPAPHPVSSMLDDYLTFELPKREAGSHQADLLEEVVAGLREYFEKCLGRILLYRFERQQYLEAREGWASAKGELASKTPVSTYGAEHFCRLLVSLPELLAQTNMDQQSCNRLCEELAKLTIWLGRNAQIYFRSEYETPGPAYIEKARTG